MDPPAVVMPPYVAGPLRLLPFRALRFAPPRVADPAGARAFARPYRDVPQRLARWQERGLLIRDTSPALYLHEYTAAGITIRGLVGALDISRRAARAEDRAVLPHEGIYPGQADELADRMAAMRINPAPILLVQHGPQPLRALLLRVRQAVPEHQFVDRAGQSHRLWLIREPGTLTRIGDLLGPSTALIADGHHRYAAYLRVQQRHPSPETDLGLAMIVDQDDTPLSLGPIHRLLVGTGAEDMASAAAVLGLEAVFMARDQALARVGADTVVVTDSDSWLAIRIPTRDGRPVVEAFHEKVVPAVSHGPTRITYHHAVEDVLRHAVPGHACAVLMPAPGLDQVLGLARDDRLLPEKATSFQPKPSPGLFIREFDEAAEPC